MGRGGLRDYASQRRARYPMSERKKDRHENKFPPDIDLGQIIETDRAGDKPDNQCFGIAEMFDDRTDHTALPDDAQKSDHTEEISRLFSREVKLVIGKEREHRDIEGKGHRHEKEGKEQAAQVCEPQIIKGSSV